MGIRKTTGPACILAFFAVHLAAGTLSAQHEDADRLRNAGRYQEAIAEYEKILSEFPTHGPALYGLGLSHTMIGQSEKGTASLRKGREYFEKLVAEHPNYAEYRHINAFSALSLVQKLKKGDGERKSLLDPAEKEVLTAMKMEKDEAKKASFRPTLARVYKEGAKHAEAIKIFKEITAKDPNPWYLLWLGESQEGTGDQDGAVETYLKALSVNANFLNVLDPLTRIAKHIKEEEKNYEKAAKLYERIVACNPHPFHHGWSLKFLGECRLQLGDVPGAIQALLDAEKIKSDEAQFPNYLGLIYLSLGEKDKAIEAFKRAIQKNPLILYPYENLGAELAAKGRIDEARQTFLDGWRASEKAAATLKDPRFKAEAEFYCFLYRWNLDQLEAYRK
ncbi:MAG: tetratricopeptide repeat protein [Planctomycetota bacterium]|jgi:tetratricopeptide (TPR) repeat protein